jgi:pre-mRNA-processing factor 17
LKVINPKQEQCIDLGLFSYVLLVTTYILLSSPDNMAGRVPTGFATETYISEHTFRQGHRAIEGGNTKKRKREGKGDTSVVSGSGAYKGPWARYEEERPDAASDDEYGSEEEVEIVYEEDEIEDNPAAAPKRLAGTDYHDTEAEGETSAFVGSQQYDYQGRTYMHVPNGRFGDYTPAELR